MTRRWLVVRFSYDILIQMIVKSTKFTDQALLKSQFPQRQREMASSLDDDNSPLVFSPIMTFVKNCAWMVRFSAFSALLCETLLLISYVLGFTCSARFKGNHLSEACEIARALDEGYIRTTSLRQISSRC